MLISVRSGRPHMRHFFVCFLFICCSFTRPAYSRSESRQYCVAQIPTPVFNTPDISSVFGGADGRTVKVDGKGLIRELEFIALPGTAFEIHQKYGKKDHEVLKVTTGDYPYDSKSLYIDNRFIRYSEKEPGNRVADLPAKKDILRALWALEGIPYMWGGNFSQGIDIMTEIYKPSGPIDGATEDLWKLKGVDCSGLLYEATGGHTPRNTSKLVTFGEALNISGLDARAVSMKLEPLDLIVWDGHVIMVMDDKTVIESSASKGVIRSGLIERVERVMRERKPADEWIKSKDKIFVIRRWYDKISSKN